jgi:hypothetical protein
MDIKSDKRFAELEDRIWKQVEEEVKAAGGFNKL